MYDVRLIVKTADTVESLYNLKGVSKYDSFTCMTQVKVMNQ